ncbi:MAG: hypothetical protein RR494_05980 [Vagococcus sp.]|uniref:hypothetical protein n=1 Tax=Vagococcus sp. TaxID=1933889 RepID=UPI002FC582CC
MVEYDNLRDALKDLYELSEGTNFTTNGKPSSFSDIQELYRERIINVLDLVGHEAIYLEEQKETP